MKHSKNYKKLRSLIGLLIILSVFIAVFQILSSLYSHRGKDYYLTVLDKGIFDVSSTNADGSPFMVDKIVRFIAQSSINEFDLLDINKIAFISTDFKEKPYSSKAGIYDLSKGVLTDELDQNAKLTESAIRISSDGKMILTSYSDKRNGSGKTYLYDIAMKRNFLSMDNVFMAEWLPDSSGFVGVDEYLFVHDVETGERKNLLRVSEYINQDQGSSIGLQVLKDGRTVCLAYSHNKGNYGIVYVDRVTGIRNQVKVAIALYGFTAISDKNIVAIGRIKGKYGLYSYDMKSNSFLQLVDIGLEDQKIGDFSVSNDGTKIAYCVIKQGSTEIHVAAIDNNKLIYDEVVYKDNKYMEKLVWTKDGRMLYFLQQSTDSTNIYRVLFKNTENEIWN